MAHLECSRIARSSRWTRSGWSAQLGGLVIQEVVHAPSMHMSNAIMSAAVSSRGPTNAFHQVYGISGQLLSSIWSALWTAQLLSEPL